VLEVEVNLIEVHRREAFQKFIKKEDHDQARLALKNQIGSEQA